MGCCVFTKRSQTKCTTELYISRESYRLIYFHSKQSRMEYLSSTSWSSPNNKNNVRPNDSYFKMIIKAIISSPTGRIALHEIYNYIRKNYPYFTKVNPTSWKNSIRHNLSIHECFIKVGKCKERKGHYRAIHPANIFDFSKGDFHRRKAKAKARDQVPVGTGPQNAALPKARPKEMLRRMPTLPSSTHHTGVYKGSSNDRSLKFNIINLLNQ